MRPGFALHAIRKWGNTLTEYLNTPYLQDEENEDRP